MLRPHSRYKLICLCSAVALLKQTHAKINLNQDYYYFVSDTDFAMVPMPEAEHVIDPELREKIMSGEQRTVHAQWANNRPGAGASKNKNKNGGSVGKLRNGVEAHSTDPNAQQPREIPEGFVRPPPGIRKLTDEEWEVRKTNLRQKEKEEKSQLEHNLDYETSDYNFGDEDWETRNCPNTTEPDTEETNLDDIIAQNMESDFEKVFKEMESIRYWNTQERALPVNGKSVPCTGDELTDTPADATQLWQSDCTKQSMEDSPFFERQYYDCGGRPLGGSNGTWYRPIVPFEGKSNTLYHAPTADELPYGDIGASMAYCRGLSSDFGNEISNFCPASLDENIYVWWHHPMQEFSHIGLGSVWTGYMRNGTRNNYDPWYCSSLKHGGTTFEDSIALYEMGDYQEWLDPAARDGSSKINYVYMLKSAPTWMQGQASSFLSRNQYTICEMNCEYFEGELYVPEDDDACTTRQAGEFPCESAPVGFCSDGKCGCFDPDFAPHPNGSCIYHVQTYEIPCGEGGAVEKIIEETLDKNDTEKVQVHGCHCVRMGETTQLLVQYIGGPHTLDELDNLCKKYFDARKCIFLPGGDCYGAPQITLESEYQLVVNYTDGTFSCDLVMDPCLKAVCLIDVEYAALILALFEAIDTGDFTALVGSEELCPNCRKGTGCVPPTHCIGEAPFVTLKRGYYDPNALRSAALNFDLPWDRAIEEPEPEFRNDVTEVQYTADGHCSYRDHGHCDVICHTGMTGVESADMSAVFSNGKFYQKGESTSFGGFPPGNAIDGNYQHRYGDGEVRDMATSDDKSASLLVKWKASGLEINTIAVWPRADASTDRYEELSVSLNGQDCECQEACLSELCIDSLVKQRKPVMFKCHSNSYRQSGTIEVGNGEDSLLQVVEVQLMHC